MILYGISTCIYFPGTVSANPFRASTPAPKFVADATAPQTYVVRDSVLNGSSGFIRNAH